VTKLSSDLAFEDFLRHLSPTRVALERGYIPSNVRRAQSYQADTEVIAEAMRVGSRTRLEAVMYGLVMAA